MKKILDLEPQIFNLKTIYRNLVKKMLVYIKKNAFLRNEIKDDEIYYIDEKQYEKILRLENNMKRILADFVKINKDTIRLWKSFKRSKSK